MLTSTQQSEAMDAGLSCTDNVQASGSAAYFDGGVVASHAGKLPGGLRAGQAYSFAYDRLLPISFGQP